MNSRDNLVQVLKRCFSSAEWVFLRRHSLFATELAGLQSVADVEKLVYLGRDLLREQETKPGAASANLSFGE